MVAKFGNLDRAAPDDSRTYRDARGRRLHRFPDWMVMPLDYGLHSLRFETPYLLPEELEDATDYER